MIELGAPVVVAEPGVVHVPQPEKVWAGPHGGARYSSFAERLEKGLIQGTWPTLCGRAGQVFLYAGLLRRREPCAICVALDEGQA